MIAVSKYPKLLIQKSFLDLSLTNGITGLTEYVIKLVSGKTFNANPGLYNQITNSISLNTIMHSEMFNYFDHEFFHFIDRQVNGLLMSDEEWDKFHKKYCNCQISKKGVFGEKDADFKKIIFGFLYNPEYAKSNSVEQRAELASTLLSPYLLDESFLRSVLSGVISEETIEQYKRSFPNLTLEDFLSAMGLLSMEVKRIVEIYKQYGWTDLNVDYLIKLRDPNIGFSRGDFLSEEGKAILYNF